MGFDYQTVRLISITKPVSDEFTDESSSEDLISYCARVSNPSNQKNFDSSSKLLRYCIDNKHWSIFEMVDITMEIRTTRDIGRQILRHRTANFQEFCVEENTSIKTKKGKMSIKEIYDEKNTKQKDVEVKTYDHESKTFIYAKVPTAVKATPCRPNTRLLGAVRAPSGRTLRQRACIERVA